LRWQGFRLTVDASHAEVTYTVRDGPDGGLTIRHAGDQLDLTADVPKTVAVQRCKPIFPPPSQPPGREPMRRHRQV
jgi:alpha,alpha-trehalose phosphorylase